MERSGTCAGYTWSVEFLSEGGDKPGMKVQQRWEQLGSRRGGYH